MPPGSKRSRIIPTVLKSSAEGVLRRTPVHVGETEVSMLLSQPTISAKECKKRADRDLKKLLKAASGAPIPIECEEHLKDYYCQLILESQSFNTCANLSDEQGLQYFECIARPIQGQKPARTAFASDCRVDSMAASGKGTKASRRFPGG